MGRKEKAVQLLNEWIKKNPHHLQSYMNRAIILRGATGLADVNFVLEKDPGRESAWLLKASLLLEANDKPGAIEAYRHVLQINPTNSVALFNVRRLTE